MKNLIGFVLLLFSLSSCWKEETPISKKERLANTYQTIAMGNSYQDVVWYDLANASVVKTMKKDDWELLISVVNDTYYLQLNTALFGQASRTEHTDWSAIINESELEYTTDGPSGELDSLCIGDWIRQEKIWVLDRGFSSQGMPYSKLKIRCSHFSENGFDMQYGPLNSAESESIFVPIRNAELGLGIKLSTDEIVQVYPENWDLCFTQYVHLFHEPYTPYLVTGVLINNNGGIQAQRTTQLYHEVNNESINHEAFQSKSNIIGYDWKYFDLDAGQYTVYPEMVFVVKNDQQRLFKLHFLDFYNEQGERGYPLFEFEEI